MLKYTLKIEGTAEEIDIEKQRYRVRLVRRDLEGLFSSDQIVRPDSIDYTVRKPAYRVKTLVELVEEFGDEVVVEGDIHCTAAIGIRGVYVGSHDLGQVVDYKFSDVKKRIFLKGVE